MSLLEEQSVVPVIGRELLTVGSGREAEPLYPLLAKRLAERLHVSSASLPADFELQEVARRYMGRTSDGHEIYRELRVLLSELEASGVPEPLVQLARITDIKLYVTTTFDFFVERALNQERFKDQRQTLVFSHAPNDKQDLPREFDRLNRPTVFHLLGRLSATPHSFPVTEEDTTEFVRSLQSKTEDSPNLLFDKLKASNLLILGSHLADWLTRFFVRNTRGGRLLETGMDFAAPPKDGRGEDVLFLQHFAGGTRAFRGFGARELVAELYARWSERQASDEQESPPPVAELLSSPGKRAGAIFLSYAGKDRGVAESIRDALDDAGVDVIFDNDDSQMGARWERKLRTCLGECALFVPVVSRHSAAAPRRFLRDEWVDAILDARNKAPSERFIMPVVVDDTPPGPSVIPEKFGELEWETLPDGEPSTTFVEKVVQLQRRYRSTSFV